MSFHHSQAGQHQAQIGVLVMAYGTPASTVEIEAYYTHIRHGHQPPPALLAELQARYQAIGGISPLLEHTSAQLRGIQSSLDARTPGRFQTILGMKHATPFLEESAAALVRDGMQRIIGLVLAPHYSSLSVGEYLQRARAALPASFPFSAIESWHLEPGYLAYLAEQVTLVSTRVQAATGIDEKKIQVIFTAHSLPARIVQTGDPYPEQLRETAGTVAKAAQLRNWSMAWQSAGRTAEPWLGPNLLDVLRELPAQGIEGVVVCPAGFVSEHLEVLYDLDIEASQCARELGLAFARTAVPNADARITEMLAELIAAHLEHVEENHA